MVAPPKSPRPAWLARAKHLAAKFFVNDDTALIEVENVADVSADLRPLVENVCGALHTWTYVLFADHHQKGVIVVQRLPDASSLGICKIYVPPKSRNRGYGKLLMYKMEEFALSLGCSFVDLDAKPFDNSISGEALTRWYLNLGYEPLNLGTNHFQKKL